MIDSAQIVAVIEAADSLATLEEARVRLLGKKGEISGLMKEIGALAPADRAAFGQRVNALRDEAQSRLDARKAILEARAEEERLAAGWIDVTAPSPRARHIGRYHPITLLLEEVIDHFTGLGFSVASGPEIEDEFHNFDALNIPKDHPARDVWDTFYTTEREIPRTHTSSVQIRTLMSQKPPLRVIAPGRVFRNETIDATHHASFNQVEGLLVDKHVSVAHLKHTLETLVAKIMGRPVPVRFRPAFYPFVEPGLDLDAQCVFCEGRGCSVCKHQGWIELIPGGLVHPRVFEFCGLDPHEWQGFAFGMGFDRMVMMRYGIDDIRRLYDGKLQLVRQF
ncbi:MAG: phenylalanine--tRNA ligase subunit alpha [Deltaproteobacteria bacterium]|nr:phenylalanine--tRNA ligase subunit alpha [Deltaproteobacteria bacterium]